MCNDRYTLVTELRENWEQGYFYMGKYYDFLLKTGVAQAQAAEVRCCFAHARLSQPTTTHDAPCVGADLQASGVAPQGSVTAVQLKYIFEVVHSYCESLMRGHQFIFQSLPRVLTVYFDFAAHIYKTGQSMESKTMLEKLNLEMVHYAAALPAYYWMTALPQLVSRICHRDEEVVTVVSVCHLPRMSFCRTRCFRACLTSGVVDYRKSSMRS